MPEPGWYADPLRRAELRWYHGAGWGEQVRTGATEGVDPIDAAGTPLWPGPRWVTPVATSVTVPAIGVALGAEPQPALGSPGGQYAASYRPAQVPRGMGAGTKTALWLVLGAFVVLVLAAVVAIVVLVRNVPRLTGDDIERQVGAAMSRQYGAPVTLDCPPVLYSGGADGTVECTATGRGFGTVAYVEVVVRDAAVVRWQVVDTADADTLADSFA